MSCQRCLLNRSWSTSFSSPLHPSLPPWLYLDHCYNLLTCLPVHRVWDGGSEGTGPVTSCLNTLGGLQCLQDVEPNPTLQTLLSLGLNSRCRLRNSIYRSCASVWTELPLSGISLSSLLPLTPTLPSRLRFKKHRVFQQTFSDLCTTCPDWPKGLLIRNSTRTALCQFTNLLCFFSLPPTLYLCLYVSFCSWYLTQPTTWQQCRKCLRTEFSDVDTALNQTWGWWGDVPPPKTLLLLVIPLMGNPPQTGFLTFYTAPPQKYSDYGKIFLWWKC